ncbi:MAG: Ig domain-containing protein, partial [Lachnospiraceae bacterium]|nr:Ig domain-containing protein [Lachnospiraceae bacterium]
TEEVEEVAELAIRNPGDKVNAYIGKKLIFYVRAEGATSYEADFGTELGADDKANKPALDSTSGKFTWTPATADEGKTYTVTLTAKRGDESVSKDVEIFAGYADRVYKTAYLTVKEDASVETWSDGNRNNDCYNDNFLRVMRGNIGDPSNTHPLGSLNNGEMGEKSATLDDPSTDLTNSNLNFEFKLSMMKFNLADLEDSDITDENPLVLTSANLSLIYCSFRNQDVSGYDGNYGLANQDENLRVVKAPSNAWSETGTNKLTWKKWIDMNIGVTYGTEGYPIEKSNTYPLTAGTAVGNANSGHSLANFDLGGNRVLTDVTSFVQGALKESADEDGNKYLSLAMTNENGTQHHFVSKEGADFYTKINERKIDHAAPTIIMNYTLTQEKAVVGSDAMLLEKGYEATGSDSFVAVGTRDLAKVSLAEGSDTAGGKIEWNEDEQTFEIAEGLAVGSYKLFLEATVNGEKVSKNFTVYVKDSLAAPKFTSPAKGTDGMAVVPAYANAPVSFAVKAEMDALGESVTSISVDSWELKNLKGASFDAETDVFTWTPSSSDLGTENSKDYTITFTATGSNGILTEQTVTIRVDREAEMEEKTGYISAINDTYVKTYGSEKSETKEGANIIHILRDLGNSGEAGCGKLGEGKESDPYDTKLGFIQFDLTEISKQKFSGANLLLTYICTETRGKEGRWGDVNLSLRVAAVPKFVWPAGGLSYNSWKEWRTLNRFSITDDEIQESKVYTLENPMMDKLATVEADNYSYIEGTKIRIDISKFLKEAIANKEDKLTLIFNTTALGTGNNYTNAQFFVSIEGATKYNNAPNVEKIPPSIILKGYADDVVIGGSDSISLVEGYEETYTNSFTVPSYDVGVPDITAISPDLAEEEVSHIEKLEWDTANSRIKVKTGLTVKAGEDSTSYQAKIAHNGLEKDFTVIVNKNYKSDLNTLKTTFAAKLGDGKTPENFTSASVANYRYILEVLEDALKANVITKAQYNAAEDLTETFNEEALVELDADYLAEQIKSYKKDTLYTEKVYTSATWGAYTTALSEAEGLSNYTEAELTAKVKALKTAYEALAIDDDETNGSAEGKLYSLILEAKKMVKNEAVYEAEAIATLKTALENADTELKKETPANVDSLATALANAMAITPVAVKQALQTAINTAIAGIPEENMNTYTAISWTAYQNALNTAKGHMSDIANENEVEGFVAPLKTAVTGLKTLAVYKTEELARVNVGVDNNANYYVETDWAAYQTALATVNAAATNTEAAINAAIADLSAKITALNTNKKPTKTKEELKALIDSIVQADYTSASWTTSGIADKLTAANTVYGKNDATVREISAAWDVLNTAKVALTPVPNEWKQLSDLMATVGALKEADWTEDSWNAMQDALDEAEKLTEASDVSAITSAYTALNTAYNNKVAFVPPSTDKTKDELDTLVQDVEDQINGADGAEPIDPSDYTEETYTKL